MSRTVAVRSLAAVALDESAAAFREDGTRAFARVLDAWRACRTETLAELVRRMAALLTRDRPTITGTRASEIQQAWLDVEAQGDPLDVDRLLASLLAGRCAEVCERVDRLATRPDDPRIRDALVAALCAESHGLITSIAMRSATGDKLPFSSKANRAFWTRHVLPLIERLGDATILIDLGVAQMRPRSSEIVRFLNDWIERRLPLFEPRTAMAGPEERAAAAKLAGLLDAAEASLVAGAQTVEALFAEVWAHPDEDAPRMVLADFLAERSDPRGEFIALQMARHHGTITREGKARERELLKRHKREWLGPIAPLIQPYNIRFERGFIVACQLEPNRELEQALGEHPAWSTIREYLLHEYSRRKGDGASLAAHIESFGAIHAPARFTRGIE